MQPNSWQQIIDTIERLLRSDLIADDQASLELSATLYRHVDSLCLSGQTSRVLSWFDRIPEHLRNQSPILALAESMALYRAGKYREGLRLAEAVWKWRNGSSRSNRFVAPGVLPDTFDADAFRYVIGHLHQSGRYRDELALIDDYLSRRTVDPAEEVPLRRFQFVALYFVGRYDEALAAGERLCELSKDNDASLANVLGSLASMNCDLGRFARARELIAEERAALSRVHDPGMLANSYNVESEMAMWEGDYAEALRLSEKAMEIARDCGQAYYRQMTILRHIETLNILGRCGDTREWLEVLDRESMTRWFEVRRDAYWALYFAHTGRGDLTVQRIATALETYDKGPASGHYATLLVLAESAVAANAPSAADLISRAIHQVPAAFPGCRAKVFWIAARHAYRSGQPVAEWLTQFVALCERHGFAGLIYHSCLATPDVFIEGLEEGVSSTLYAASMPVLSPEQAHRVARLVANRALPMAVRRTAFELATRQADTPAAGEAIAAATASEDPQLQAAGRRLATSMRVAQALASTIQFLSLGGFDLLHRGQSIIRGWRQKAKVLFVYLLLQTPRALPRKMICETIWPDLEPDAASNNLRVTLHALRRDLNRFLAPDAGVSELLMSDGETIRLSRPEQIAWDARELEQFVAVARRCLADGQEDEAVSSLAHAVHLYHGPFLSGAGFDGYFDEERRHYARLAFEAMVELAALSLDRGELDRALEVAEAAVAVDSLDEQGHLLVMRTQAALGYPHRVMEAFRRYEEVLNRELGERPSPNVQTLLKKLTRSG